ncbi:penicillin-binding protein activator [Alteromonas sp. ASW11-19]|uniref:Penicillin-binding protein activator n=1 Tax=Alteromonas salexigens TaxID=2982530 RepID=A0ABT2VQX3_9ALTE|nr:penicillin-binding protein activator [Alteromonas salexigens]MCU7555474.1 penicillin-binding protein activator [Alteromonas salexigens]
MRDVLSQHCKLLGAGISTLLLISACSAPPSQRSASPSQVNTLPSTTVDADASPASLLAEARSIWQTSRDQLQRDTLLLQAAQLALESDDTGTARNILLSLQQQELDPRLQARADVLTALAFAEASEHYPEEMLALLSTPADDDALRYGQLDLLTQLYLRQGDLLAAANSYEQAMPPSDAHTQQVWQWVNSVSPLPQDAEQRFPALRPYFALRSLLANHGLNTQELAEATAQFKQVYRGHRLVTYWPEEVAAATGLSSPNITEILVMLPLSGRLETTGMAIKEGILSAYYRALNQTNNEQPLPELEFVDTVGKSPQALRDAIGQHRWIIGPLLKETIEQLVPLLPPYVNMLALNRADEIPAEPSPLTSQAPQEMAITAEPGFFALAPEDEAYQLAEKIFHKGYRAPIVVAADSSIYQRMNEAFEVRWQTLTRHQQGDEEIQLTSVSYTDNDSLREGITRALDVEQSKDRINQIRYMVNEELYNVPRSRGDIDAIVVFASPEQTELLNPMVEASLSPFDGKVVPVYATSRSMEYDSGKNQWRDLQNVRFLDMPWMMPEHPWQDVKAETEQLWPHRSTQLDRLFAFGVDAYNLLPSLPAMGLLTQVEIEGLTGTLRMNADHQIERRLPQAKIDNERVILLKQSD